MKKLIAGVALGAAFIPVLALAADVRVGEQPSISAGDRVTQDAYLAGGSVRSAGTIDGDLLAAGGTIVLNGSVGADVAAAGGNVTVLSAVADDLRLLGGQVSVEGAVGGDLIAGGGQVSIGGPGIKGEAIIGGGTVRLEAPVAGNVRIAGGDIYINAPIGGNLTVYNADKITLGSHAAIVGNFTYTAGREAVIESGATIHGVTTYKKTERGEGVSAATAAALLSAAFLAKMLTLIVCALIAGLFFKRYALELVGRAQKNPLAELGRGFVFLVVLPAASIVLLITLLGIPFGILGFLAFGASLLASWVLAPIVIGARLAKLRGHNGADMVSWKWIIVGAVVYALLGLVPVVGWLVQFAAILITLGAGASIKWEGIREWR